MIFTLSHQERGGGEEKEEEEEEEEEEKEEEEEEIEEFNLSLYHTMIRNLGMHDQLRSIFFG